VLVAVFLGIAGLSDFNCAEEKIVRPAKNRKKTNLPASWPELVGVYARSCFPPNNNRLVYGLVWWPRLGRGVTLDNKFSH